MLRDKTLTQLRGMAQSFGIKDIFAKDTLALIQAIEQHQQDLLPPSLPPVTKPEYDYRLMNKPPSKRSDKAILEELAQPYIARGMSLTLTEEQWFIRCGKKTDQGTLRMPPRVFLGCCDAVVS